MAVMEGAGKSVSCTCSFLQGVQAVKIHRVKKSPSDFVALTQPRAKQEQGLLAVGRDLPGQGAHNEGEAGPTRGLERCRRAQQGARPKDAGG